MSPEKVFLVRSSQNGGLTSKSRPCIFEVGLFENTFVYLYSLGVFPWATLFQECSFCPWELFPSERSAQGVTLFRSTIMDFRQSVFDFSGKSGGPRQKRKTLFSGCVKLCRLCER